MSSSSSTQELARIRAGANYAWSMPKTSVGAPPIRNRSQILWILWISIVAIVVVVALLLAVVACWRTQLSAGATAASFGLDALLVAAVACGCWAVHRVRARFSSSATARDTEHLRAVVETATEGVVAIDDRGLIESINPAAVVLFGYEAGELIGKNVNVLMPSPDREQHDGYIQNFIRSGKKRIIGIGRDVTGRRKDGTAFPLFLSVGQGFANGRQFFTGILRDMTRQHELQEQLNHAERLAAIGELAAGVAHEVNTPVNTITNCAELILDGEDPDESCKIIVAESERIATIVRSLLRFSRTDEASPLPTSLAEIVEQTLHLIAANMHKHGIALRVDIPDAIPQVMARPQQLQQVLLNLLVNAKDAILSGEGPDRTLTISATESAASQGETVDLRVHDTGPGIPPDLQRRIFSPFVTTKRATGGTGLGLSISHRIVTELGGTIQVRCENTGTTFTVTLPTADDTSRIIQ